LAATILRSLKYLKWQAMVVNILLKPLPALPLALILCYKCENQEHAISPLHPVATNGNKELAENHVKIKQIKLKELERWASGIADDPAYQQVVPISLTRAVSQSKNPYARPDDAVLFVAFHGDRCIGYHGLLPAVFRHGHDFARVHWATTFFVAPDFRGQGIGKLLLNAILNSRIDFAVCQITESARRAYRSTGFKHLGQLNYFQLRVDRLDFISRLFDAAAGRLHANSLPPRSGPPDFIRRVQRPVYRLTKELFYRRVAGRSKRRHPRKFTWKMVARIDSRLCDASHRQPAGASFFRGSEAVNWMLRYPWVVSANGRKAGLTRYYFSDVRDLFRYVAIEVESAEKAGPQGFLVLSISHKKKKTRVKILDFYFNNPADREIAVYLALKQAGIYLADRIEYPCSLANYFSPRAEFKKLIKKQSRLYLFYPQSSNSPLAVCRGKIAFDYCDGDTALA
jgi:GNAT superfamily N-acetyltransferase